MSFNLAPLRRQILDFAIKSPRISQALNLFGRAVNALSYAKVPLYCSPLYSRKISIDNIRAELHFNARYPIYLTGLSREAQTLSDQVNSGSEVHLTGIFERYLSNIDLTKLKFKTPEELVKLARFCHKIEKSHAARYSIFSAEMYVERVLPLLISKSSNLAEFKAWARTVNKFLEEQTIYRSSIGAEECLVELLIKSSSIDDFNAWAQASTKLKFFANNHDSDSWDRLREVVKVSPDITCLARWSDAFKDSYRFSNYLSSAGVSIDPALSRKIYLAVLPKTTGPADLSRWIEEVANLLIAAKEYPLIGSRILDYIDEAQDRASLRVNIETDLNNIRLTIIEEEIALIGGATHLLQQLFPPMYAALYFATSISALRINEGTPRSGIGLLPMTEKDYQLPSA